PAHRALRSFPTRRSSDLIAVCIAIPLGVIAGKNRGSLTDNALSVIALVGISLPSFVIGPMLVYLFAVKLGWLSPSGRFDWSDIIDRKSTRLNSSHVSISY